MPHRWDLVAPPVTGLVRPVPIDPEGSTGPTRGRANGPRWRRTSAGLFVPAAVDDDLVEQRIVEVAASVGERAVVTGWAALRLLGGGWFDGLGADGRTRLPVVVAANGSRVRPRPGVVVWRDTMPDDEVVEAHGVRCARAERAVFDEMRRLGVPRLREMVVVADMACGGRLTSLRRLRNYNQTRRWFRDKRVVLAPLVLASEHSRSGPETLFRLIWVLDARWPPPLCNRGVLDLDGRPLGTPDLLDPECGIVGEFAGADHRQVEQHEHDIHREAAFRRVGLEYVEVVGRDLRYRPRVVSRLTEAAARAGVHPRCWQLAPPPSPTLDEFLDARDGGVE